MNQLKLSAISYSLILQPLTIKQWQDHLLSEILELYEGGSRVILYPELFLAGLARYFNEDRFEGEKLKDIADFTWKELLPGLEEKLPRDLFLCLGSGPRHEDGGLFNASPIWCHGKWTWQSKIHLTPWESSFRPGQNLSIYEFMGLRTAVIICFDIEQPGLGYELKKHGIDLILVPSATSTVDGSHRVNRCASARSIELGAAVLTAPLVGKCTFDLIDANEGRQGFFLPAQAAVKVQQEEFSEYSFEAHIVNSYLLDLDMMKTAKIEDDETKPYFVNEIRPHIIERS